MLKPMSKYVELARSIGQEAIISVGLHDPCNWPVACAILAQRFIQQIGCTDYFENYLEITNAPIDNIDFQKTPDERIMLTCLAYDADGEANAYAMSKLEIDKCWLYDVDSLTETDPPYEWNGTKRFMPVLFLTYGDLDILDKVPPSMEEKTAQFNKVSDAACSARDYMQQFALGGVQRRIGVMGVTDSGSLVPWTQEGLLKRLEYISPTPQQREAYEQVPR
jgi:hypothetical protein